MLFIGQVLWFRMRFNNNKDEYNISDDAHPYLIYKYDENTNRISLVQMDKLTPKNRVKKLSMKGNVLVSFNDPDEKVIYRDSYAQIDNEFTIDYFPELEIFKHTEELMSNIKFGRIREKYEWYRANYEIDANKIVHITKEEFIELNKDKLSA